MADSPQKQYLTVIAVSLSILLEFTVSAIQKTLQNGYVVYPLGKPRIPHLLSA